MRVRRRGGAPRCFRRVYLRGQSAATTGEWNVQPLERAPDKSLCLNRQAKRAQWFVTAMAG